MKATIITIALVVFSMTYTAFAEGELKKAPAPPPNAGRAEAIIPDESLQCAGADWILGEVEAGRWKGPRGTDPTPGTWSYASVQPNSFGYSISVFGDAYDAQTGLEARAQSYWANTAVLEGDYESDQPDCQGVVGGRYYMHIFGNGAQLGDSTTGIGMIGYLNTQVIVFCDLRGNGTFTESLRVDLAGTSDSPYTVSLGISAGGAGASVKIPLPRDDSAELQAGGSDVLVVPDRVSDAFSLKLTGEVGGHMKANTLGLLWGWARASGELRGFTYEDPTRPFLKDTEADCSGASGNGRDAK